MTNAQEHGRTSLVLSTTDLRHVEAPHPLYSNIMKHFEFFNSEINVQTIYL